MATVETPEAPVVEEFIERIEVFNYQNLGQKFIQWAEDEKTRPGTIGEVEEQLAGIVKVPLPKWLKYVEFKQVTVDDGILLIRLPPKKLIEDTRRRIRAGEDYILPEFYADKILRNEPEDGFDFFEFRVGDYTISHCM